MRWATWENVGIDRIGCAWLILREIDPQAEFVFVKRGEEMPRDAIDRGRLVYDALYVRLQQENSSSP